MTSELLSVGGAAKRLGVSPSFLRKLEYTGVTLPARRISGSDRRVYTTEEVDQLRTFLEERRASRRRETAA